MPLTVLLSAYSRAVLQTLLAVFFGAYIPKHIFRTRTLPAIQRPNPPQLPSYKPTPILLIEPPPPPHIADCFPTNVARNDPFTLWLSSYAVDAVNYGQVPVEEVDSTLYSIAVLATYLLILSATIFYASWRQPARRGPDLYIAELYEYLTGLPYAPTEWERVLHSQSPEVNSADCWDAYGVRFYDPKLSDDVEALITESSSSGAETPDEGPRYAAWIDKGKLDVFWIWMIRLGFTDLRKSVEDVSPPTERPDAILVDFRYSIKDASEILCKIVMRFVTPSDVPNNRTDFIFWDFSEGWFRAFEEYFAQENLAYLAILPFYGPLEEMSASGVALNDDQPSVPGVKASVPGLAPLAINNDAIFSNSSATLPDMDAFSDLGSPTASSPSWLADVFPRVPEPLSDPVHPEDDTRMSGSFVVVPEGQEAIEVLPSGIEDSPEPRAHNTKVGQVFTEQVVPEESPAVDLEESTLKSVPQVQEDGVGDSLVQEHGTGDLMADLSAPASVPTPSVMHFSTEHTFEPVSEPREPEELDLTNSLGDDSDSASTVAPSTMDESWADYLSESMYKPQQPQETDLGAMNDGDFVDVTAELESEAHTNSVTTEPTLVEPTGKLHHDELPVAEAAQPVVPRNPAPEAAIVDIFRIIEEAHAADELPADPVDEKRFEDAKVDDAGIRADAAPVAQDVQYLLDAFDEDLSFEDTDATEPDDLAEDASTVEGNAFDALLDDAQSQTVVVEPVEPVEPIIEEVAVEAEDVQATHDGPTEEPGTLGIAAVEESEPAMSTGIEELGSIDSALVSEAPEVAETLAEPEEVADAHDATEESAVVNDTESSASVALVEENGPPTVTSTEKSETFASLAVHEPPQGTGSLVESEGLTGAVNATEGSVALVRDAESTVSTVVTSSPVEPKDAIVDACDVAEDAPAVVDTEFTDFVAVASPIEAEVPAMDTGSEGLVADAPMAEPEDDINAATPEPEVVPADSDEVVEDVIGAQVFEGTTPADTLSVVEPEVEIAMSEETAQDIAAIETIEDVTPVTPEETVEVAVPETEARQVEQAIADGFISVEGFEPVDAPEKPSDSLDTERPSMKDAPAEDIEGDAAPVAEEAHAVDTSTETFDVTPSAPAGMVSDESVEDSYAEATLAVEESAPAPEVDATAIPLPDDLDENLTVPPESAPIAINPADVPLPEDQDENLALSSQPIAPATEESELVNSDVDVLVSGELGSAISEPVDASEDPEVLEDIGVVTPTVADEATMSEAPEISVPSMDASIGTLLDAAANSVWSLPAPETTKLPEGEDGSVGAAPVAEEIEAIEDAGVLENTEAHDT